MSSVACMKLHLLSTWVVCENSVFFECCFFFLRVFSVYQAAVELMYYMYLLHSLLHEETV